MQQTKVYVLPSIVPLSHVPSHIAPSYAESFRCIGSACEDTCCKGWAVPVDPGSIAKFQTLPASVLKTLIETSIVPATESGNAQHGVFATFRMTASNQCPMLSEERLCQIQSECGEAFLPHTCSVYPRIIHRIGDVEQEALTLSCPEAARLVLLNPDLLATGRSEPFRHYREVGGLVEGDLAKGDLAKNDLAQNGPALRNFFWPIQHTALALIRNRDYPLWQRLVLLGIFCRDLDAIARCEVELPIPAFLSEFEGMVRSGALRAAMDALLVDLASQLDVVLRLAGMLLHTSNVHPRFADCVQAFTSGIGNGPSATMASLTAHYARAHDEFYAPFFDRHPRILENYLINTVLRCQFPFGRDGMLCGSSSTGQVMAREHANLTAQFTLMKGFLIGVAGFHGDAFSTEHVVHTVQSASKHFEHHPEFLNQAHALLVESKMEDELGLAILLRNA